ncbi:MAG: zinc-dependent metalloprotease, partial [bacterium]
NTIVMSWSFHRLPDLPMMPRYCDDRVGYFEARVTDYSDVYQRVHSKCFIRRFRLEKKDSTAALSDPVHPIVFYLDPATPTKWIPYFKRAIESWQPAFEAAGFTHAIVAREAPKDDPDWSPEDARYSVVRWLPSALEDASGPHVFDPRSGEVLSAHIQFYENAEKFLYSMYFLQASAVDRRARTYPLPDSLMGRLLEYMLAHEVGHTLGFGHNMKASAMYPVDSLRSVRFLAQWGHTPSIMDYARFNYLVQPEDQVPLDLLVPRIGPYDIWATKWGYAPLGASTPEDELPTLDAWSREQDTKPYLRFSTEGSADSDPGEESEAVGDADAIKATVWGLRNIKREVGYLLAATTKPYEPTDFLNELYGRLMLQWRWELTHVANIVGGADSQEKYGTQPGVRFITVSRARQQAAVRFVNEKAFRTPTFFLDQSILRRIEPSGSVARIVTAQNSVLSALLQPARLMRMSEQAAFALGEGYSPRQLFADLRNGLFGDVASSGSTDIYRRALQRAYVENLSGKLNPPVAVASASSGAGGGAARPVAPILDPKLSDLIPAVRGELHALDALLSAALPKASDREVTEHIIDLRHRIALALNRRNENGAD